MRIAPLVLLPLVTGCSAAPFFSGNKVGISADSVRMYAKSHGLSRDEARRELELYRDADYLKELRQQQAAVDSPGAAAEDAAAGNQPSSR